MDLPLTLTLSPQAGRGDAGRKGIVHPQRRKEAKRSRARSFSPLAGRRWRQPDEGQKVNFGEHHAKRRFHHHRFRLGGFGHGVPAVRGRQA
ncbi:hypothetical protein ACO34A_06560 [Rhizobium sp. ACO-34A]|nr:hypothetical protein ACO34A_06560 [Rhizobium sp. ACO-34A]